MKTLTDRLDEMVDRMREQRDGYYELTRKLYSQVCEQNRIIIKVCKREPFTADDLMHAAHIKQKSCEVIAEADGRRAILKTMKERHP